MVSEQGRNLGRNEHPVSESENGARIGFADLPGIFRSFILNPGRIKTSLAERMSGFTETTLGEFDLDGKLFSSVRFSLIIESDEDKRQKKPTAIIRADLKLGESQSLLNQLQESRMRQEDVNDPFFEKFGSNFNPNVAPYLYWGLGEGIHQAQWSKNIVRIYPPLKRAIKLPETPLVVLQLWDKDAGPGFISISLVSYGRYNQEWVKNHDLVKEAREKQWEADEDDIDRWKFSKRVGVDVDDEKRFKRSLVFFTASFDSAMDAMYKTEGLNAPNLSLNLELPIVGVEKGERITFDDIGSRRAVVDYLKGVAQGEMRQKLVSPLQQPILLYGEPGNGKTTLAKAFASELEVDPVVKQPSDLAPDAKGDDIIRFLESAYLEAKAKAAGSGSKSMLLLEQLDSILGDNIRVHDSFIGMMDRWKEEREVILMATSNLVAFHPAIVSRFDSIHVPAPDVLGKEEILKQQAAKIGKIYGKEVFSGVDFSLVAKEISNFSVRDMVKLLSIVYRQSLLMNQPIDTKFILDLIPKLVPQAKKHGFITS